MKILFVENRYKTFLWEKIGEEFQKDGHKIHWIVQNHSFIPSFGNISVLPYPEKNEQPKDYTPEIQKIINSDRGLNYFEIHSDDFIFWYQKKIDELIQQIAPEVVFGESTLFHELLVISSCKKRDILYLHPSTCRYPSNRFSFYKYDTLFPFGESAEKWENQKVTETVMTIVNRSSMPDYMKVHENGPTKFDLLKNKLKLSLAYFAGERYNTPSPFKKISINKHFNSNIAAYESIAVDQEEIKTEFNVLYALQMQPEANIDVWGSPNRNQIKVIERIINDLEENQKLILKPNPKSKYEISSDLISLIKKHSNIIIPLKHETKMSDIWSKADLVVTVTGTVSIECIFSNKPVVMLGRSLQETQKNCALWKTEENLQVHINKVKNGTFPKLSDDEKNDYLKLIINTSFEGINGDGLQGKHYIDDSLNYEKIVSAYKQILNESRKHIQ